MMDVTELLEEYASGVRNFAGVNLNGFCLYRANLQEINLQSANLIGANLSGADLTGAHLKLANLHKANLSRETLLEIELESYVS